MHREGQSHQENVMGRGGEGRTHTQVLIDDEILVLDVAVGDAVLDQVAHRVDNLGEDISRLCFGKSLVWRLFDVLEEVV
jgi:hypothetical protein